MAKTSFQTSDFRLHGSSTIPQRQELMTDVGRLGTPEGV